MRPTLSAAEASRMVLIWFWRVKAGRLVSINRIYPRKVGLIFLGMAIDGCVALETLARHIAMKRTATSCVELTL